MPWKYVCNVRVLAWVLWLATGFPSFGQSPTSGDQPSPASHSAKPTESSSEDSGRVGIGAKASLLGGGVEVAVRTTHRANVRAGFNIISYSRGFSQDGFAYNGQLSFKTFEAHYDFFPWAGNFHLSPGVLAYFGDPITATASVPAGQSFSLGGVTYYSDTTTPVTGNGKIDFDRVSPMATVGWGNLIPRSSRHFSIPFELGVAFQGSPQATLNLAGNVCDSPGANCRPIPSDPVVQNQIKAEQTKITNSMSLFKVYPVISVGFGYKF
ncbi:MAG: hypothetical protein WBV69_10590 [Candidatus Sulfotelmatobacter sp.]